MENDERTMGTGDKIVAEYSEVMREWRRMCLALEKQYGYANSCANCPLDGCAAIYEMDEDTMDFQEMENKIMAWAAEHPGPVFPTWEEWLSSLGLVEKRKLLTTEYGVNEMHQEMKELGTLTPKAYNPISESIAEKLGIEPRI